MSFNYGTRHLSDQQQAIIRKRERADQIRKEESETKGRDGGIEYKFEYSEVKHKLTNEEYDYFMEELERHKNIIVETLLDEEKKGNSKLYSAIATKDVPDGEFKRIISTGFYFSRTGDIINITKAV